jgi:hypothetical protein
VAGRRQGEPQPCDAEHPEPSERPGQAVQIARGVTGQAGHPVGVVLAEDGGGGVVGRGESGQQGIAPRGEAP